MVAKHRRSEKPSPESAGRHHTAEYWPEGAGYDRGAWSGTVRPMAGRAATAYPASDIYDDTPAEQGWAAGPDGQSWQEWQDWEDGPDWGPGPVLHPDHPSAPVPRVNLPAEHPSGPMWIPRNPGASGRGPRGSSAPPPRGPGGTRGPGRRDAVTTTATLGYLSVHREVNSFPRQSGRPGRHASSDQGPAGPGLREHTDNRRDDGQYVPGPGPAADWFEFDRSQDEDSLWMAGQVLTLADDKAAQLAEEARSEAAAVREAAQREAAAIREAAQRETAEMRERLNSMLGELSRITAYLSQSLVEPVTAAAAPAMSAMPATAPALPRTAPARPKSAPGRARPATRPAKPSVRPATKPAGRQAKAMRKFTAAFAVVTVLGAMAGGAEVALHGLPFFMFRANGAGASEVGPREPANPPRAGQPFLPGQQSAAHHKPGAHRKPAAQPQTTAQPQPSATTK